MTFSAPSSSTESVKVADLAGFLLIIEPIEYKVGIQTVHGETDAIEVNLVDLDNSKTYNNVLFFNVALKNSLKAKVGQKVLARIGQGVAKPGKSAPWILLDSTGDAVAVAKANAFISGPKANITITPAVVTTPAGITPEVAALLAQLGAQQK